MFRMENKELVAAVEELIQETRCPICLDFFVRPRTAPCTHSFCEACIYECIKDNHSECPSCRYPGCNKRALSLNHTLMNLTATVRKVAVLMGLAEESLSQVQHEKELWKPDHQRNSGRAPTVPKKRKRKGGDTSKPVEPVAGEDAVPPVAGGSLQAEQAAAGSSSAGAGEGAPGQTAGSSTVSTSSLEIASRLHLFTLWAVPNCRQSPAAAICSPCCWRCFRRGETSSQARSTRHEKSRGLLRYARSKPPGAINCVVVHAEQHALALWRFLARN